MTSVRDDANNLIADLSEISGFEFDCLRGSITGYSLSPMCVE